MIILCCLLDLPLVFLGDLFRTLLTEIFKNDTEDIREISGISHSAEWSPGSQSRPPGPATVERSWGGDLHWKIASSCCSQNKDSHGGESPDTAGAGSTICHDYLTSGNHQRKTLSTRNSQNRRPSCAVKMVRCGDVEALRFVCVVTVIAKINHCSFLCDC